MKKLIPFILVFVAFLLFSCTEEKKEEPISTLPSCTFEIKASSFGKAKLKNDTVNVLFLETTINNNTNDTLRFGSMSCSWSDIYTLSNPKLSLDVPECDKNSPIIIKVIPQTNAKTFFNVILGKIEKGSAEKLKAGLKLVEIKEDSDPGTIFEKIHSFPADSILWSNEIEL